MKWLSECFRGVHKGEIFAIIVLGFVCMVKVILDWFSYSEPSVVTLRAENARLQQELATMAQRIIEVERSAKNAEAERDKAFARVHEAQKRAQAAQELVIQSHQRESEVVAGRARQEREQRGIKSLRDASDAELEIMAQLHGVPKDQIRDTPPNVLLLIKQKRELEEQLKKLREAAEKKAAPPKK